LRTYVGRAIRSLRLRDVEWALAKSLSQDARLYIRAKEVEALYPLNQVNDMRALVNFAPWFADTLARVTSGLPPTSWLHGPRRMSTARCVRLHMVILVAFEIAWRLTGRLAIQQGDLLRALASEHVFRLRDYPLCEQIPPPADAPWLEAVSELGRSTQLLHVKARELADKAGMGEHPLFSLAPVPLLNQYLSQAFFYQRTCRGFPHRLLFTTRLAVGTRVSDPHPFRGSLPLPLPSSARLAWQLWIDDEPVRDLSAVHRITEVVDDALQVLAVEEAELGDPSAAAIRKVLLYSAELNELDGGRFSRLDALASVTENRVIRALRLPPEGPFADHFLSLVDAGFDRWKTTIGIQGS